MRRRRPNADSGLRNPADPTRVIANKDVTPEELFTAARLVVSAEIAKIHTTEWTPQLLYNEPLYQGMNANWNGLLGTGEPEVSKALSRYCGERASESPRTWRRPPSGIRCSLPGRAFSGSAARCTGYDITKPEIRPMAA